MSTKRKETKVEPNKEEFSDSFLGPWDAVVVALVLLFIYKVVSAVIQAHCG